MLHSPSLRRQVLAKLSQRGCDQAHTASTSIPTRTSRHFHRLHHENSTSSRPLLHKPQKGYASNQQRRGYNHYFPPEESRLVAFLRRRLNALVYLGIGAVIGTGMVYGIDEFINRTLHNIEKNENLVSEISTKAGALPLVQRLLASPEWSSHHHNAYASFDEESRPKRFTTGPLGKWTGIGGYQHVFHNSVTGEVLTVVHIGHATSGWPGVVHGGVVATLMDEQCARAAMEDATFVGAGANKQGIVTAQLDVNYRKPTGTGNFYVVKAKAIPEEELEAKEKGKRGRKVWVQTSLETIKGEVCAEGKALYVKPAGVNLRAVGGDF